MQCTQKGVANFLIFFFFFFFMETKKILLTLSFFTAIFLANVSGPQYVFPTFGPSLATRFHWSSMENSVVGTAVFVGVSFSGPLCAWLVEHLGFRKYVNFLKIHVHPTVII